MAMDAKTRDQNTMTGKKLMLKGVLTNLPKKKKEEDRRSYQCDQHVPARLDNET